MRLLFLAILVLFLPSASVGQEGSRGQGHEEWHGSFYSKLLTPQTRVSCCNLADCRPTSGRQVGDHWEVKVNGNWIRVLPDKIVPVGAPDQGFHVCAPLNFSGKPEHIYCVVLPPEG